MNFITFITILGIGVAVIGGLNTILEFCERLHSYYKALSNKRRLNFLKGQTNRFLKKSPKSIMIPFSSGNDGGRDFVLLDTDRIDPINCNRCFYTFLCPDLKKTY